MRDKYHPDLIGQIALAIYNHHKDRKIVYRLDPYAEEVYEHIAEKYNGQFNLKYSGLLVLYKFLLI